MENIGEILSSGWTGSAKTYELVKAQIKERWGEEMANIYDPRENVFTYKEAARRGWRIKRGEKALRSITFIETDKVSGIGATKKIPKAVCLFFLPQQAERIS